MHLAAFKGDAEVVRALMIWGAPADVVDDAGDTPLHIACALGYAATARALIDAGTSSD